MKEIAKNSVKMFAIVDNCCTFAPTVPAKPLYNAQIGRSSFFIGFYLFIFTISSL